MSSDFEKLEHEVDADMRCLELLRSEDERLFAEVRPRVTEAVLAAHARSRRIRPWLLWAPSLGGVAAAVALFASFAVNPSHTMQPAAKSSVVVSVEDVEDLDLAMSASSEGIASMFTDSSLTNRDSDSDDLRELQDFYETLTESPRGGA